MYAGDGDSWVAWFAGLAQLTLGGAAYVADEAANVGESECIKAIATYQVQHAGSAPTHQLT
jgi:hypothetical protein